MRTIDEKVLLRTTLQDGEKGEDRKITPNKDLHSELDVVVVCGFRCCGDGYTRF